MENDSKGSLTARGTFPDANTSALLPSLSSDVAKVATWTLADVTKDLVGILGGDWLREVRIRNIDKFARRTEEILKERNVPRESLYEVSPALTRPILDAVQDQSSEELQELWARLMASAADPVRKSTVRKAFVDTLREFDPIDALVFEKLASLSGDVQPSRMEFIARALNVGMDEVSISFDNLVRFNCANDLQNPDSGRGGADTSLTSFGRQLARQLQLM